MKKSSIKNKVYSVHAEVQIRHCKEIRIIVPEKCSYLVPRVQLSGTKSTANWYQECSIGITTVSHSFAAGMA